MAGAGSVARWAPRPDESEDNPLLARADVRWSLSPLTFLHEWARVLVVEQVYRAAKIARDEPYHH